MGELKVQIKGEINVNDKWRIKVKDKGENSCTIL